MTTIDRSACPGRCHGTVNAYKRGRCRCPDARALVRAYERRYRSWPKGDLARSRKHHDVDEQVVYLAARGEPLPLGTTERRIAVAALTAAGKSTFQIALTLGCTARTVCRARAWVRDHDTPDRRTA
jgi:DNA-binding NarL/FixJ family response regulator